MQLVTQQIHRDTPDSHIIDHMKIVEKYGRKCWKSEGLTNEMSYDNFIRMLIKREHESVLEHSLVSYSILTSRSVTHQLIRHRVGMSYSQESQRYCNYSKGKFSRNVNFMQPVLWDTWDEETQQEILDSFSFAELKYFNLIENRKLKAEDAREVLPNAALTDIGVSGNFRSWRHFLGERLSAQLPIRMISLDIYDDLIQYMPPVLDDLAPLAEEARISIAKALNK